MKKMNALFMCGVAAVLLCGCQSTPNSAPPVVDEDLRAEMDEQEKKRIYDEYMLQQSIMRQREEVARNRQRERQQQRENNGR